MDEAAIEQYRKALLRLQAELRALGETSREAGDTVELDQTRVGRLSRMDAMQSQQMALETARRRQQRLAMIDGALRRMDSGDFGYCFVCGEEIDKRRLEIDPAISRCMACVDK
ncbi:MAG: TraR/DksA C4-type zinc finger protein [Gammaproteobacteria bacterium]|nr:TraR/DksA C4-type zinc finger protein [Gammaproteobacteria bacterium]